MFAELYGTNELLSSFDSINVTRPGTNAKGGWLHVDQAPLKQGVQCIQGLVNLVDVGPHTTGKRFCVGGGGGVPLLVSLFEVPVQSYIVFIMVPTCTSVHGWVWHVGSPWCTPTRWLYCCHGHVPCQHCCWQPLGC